MSTSCSVTDVARNFADYVNRVAYRGERFILTRSNRPVAELGPVPRGLRLADLPEVMASLPRLSEREAKGFAKDVDRARKQLDKQPVRDPWES